MRIDEHPVLNFDRGEKVTFYYNGKEVEGYTNETIVAALHVAGIRKLGSSQEHHRPRGLFCAIGNCSSCFMIVDGIPNTKVCITKCRQGMQVQEQNGKETIKA